MANNHAGPTAEQKKLQAALAGTQALIPAKSSETVGGVTFTQPQLLSKLQAWVQTFNDVETLRT